MKKIITVLTLLLSILAVSTCQPEDPIDSNMSVGVQEAEGQVIDLDFD